MNTLQVGDQVRHKKTGITGIVKNIYRGFVATIVIPGYDMSEHSRIKIDTQVCLIENLEKID